MCSDAPHALFSGDTEDSEELAPGHVEVIRKRIQEGSVYRGEGK